MLKVPAAFPFPGSFAIYDQYLWRVRQHIAGEPGEGSLAILDREGAGGCFTRRAPVRDLLDPQGVVALRPDAHVGLALAAALRDADVLLTADLPRLADQLIASGRLQWRPGVRQIERLLPDLGWARDTLNGRRCWRRTAFSRQSEGEAA